MFWLVLLTSTGIPLLSFRTAAAAAVATFAHNVQNRAQTTAGSAVASASASANATASGVMTMAIANTNGSADKLSSFPAMGLLITFQTIVEQTYHCDHIQLNGEATRIVMWKEKINKPRNPNMSDLDFDQQENEYILWCLTGCNDNNSNFTLARLLSLSQNAIRLQCGPIQWANIYDKGEAEDGDSSSTTSTNHFAIQQIKRQLMQSAPMLISIFKEVQSLSVGLPIISKTLPPIVSVDQILDPDLIAQISMSNQLQLPFTLSRSRLHANSQLLSKLIDNRSVHCTGICSFVPCKFPTWIAQSTLFTQILAHDQYLISLFVFTHMFPIIQRVASKQQRPFEAVEKIIYLSHFLFDNKSNDLVGNENTVEKRQLPQSSLLMAYRILMIALNAEMVLVALGNESELVSLKKSLFEKSLTSSLQRFETSATNGTINLFAKEELKALLYVSTNSHVQLYQPASQPTQIWSLLWGYYKSISLHRQQDDGYKSQGLYPSKATTYSSMLVHGGESILASISSNDNQLYSIWYPAAHADSLSYKVQLLQLLSQISTSVMK